MVRALASHQCGPGSSPGLGVRCGLSLLLVLVLAPRGFSPGTPVFPSPQKPTFLNSNSIWTQWTKRHLVDVPLLIPIYVFIYFLFFIYLSITLIFFFLCFKSICIEGELVETLSMVLSFSSTLQNEIKSVSSLEFLITKAQFKRRTVYMCRT